MDRAVLKSTAKTQIKGNLGVLFVISLVICLITVGVNLIPVLGSVASVVLSVAFALSMATIYLNLTDGIKPKVSDAFSQISNFWPAFKVSFLVGLFTWLWSLLFVIPGIIKSISYSQAFFILAEDPTMGARDAIRKSQEMMAGHKMEYFLLGLSFIGWAILGAFTFGLLYIWLMPYMQTTFANFYKQLKTAHISC